MVKRRRFKLKTYWVQDMRTNEIQKDVRKIETEGLFEGLLLMREEIEPHLKCGESCEFKQLIVSDREVLVAELEKRLFGEQVS